MIEFLTEYGMFLAKSVNESRKSAGRGDHFILISSVDAQKRGIEDGEAIWVFNDRGEFEGDAQITDYVNAVSSLPPSVTGPA